MFQLIREFVKRRTLVWVLTRRDLIARYRGTALGFLWTFLNPLLLFGVYALVFGYFVRVELPDGNYSAFLISGLLPWTWFAGAIAISSTSILADAGWIRQASFPPTIPPLVANVSGLMNFVFGVPILIGVLWLLGSPPSPWLACLPLVMALQFVFALGLSMAAAALTVRYRDVGQLIGAVLPLWFFLTPIIYPASQVPQQFQLAVKLNPMAHLAKAYQAIFYERAAPDPKGLAVVGVCALVAMIFGSAVMSSLRDRIPEEL